MRFFLAALVLKMTFEAAYVWDIYPAYSYLAMNYDPNVTKAAISWVLLLAVSLVIPHAANRVSTHLLHVLCLLLLVPLLSYYWLGDKSSEYIFFVVGGIFCASVLIRVHNGLADPRAVAAPTVPNFSSPLWAGIFIVFILAAILLAFQRGGVDERAFSFDTIYDLRRENETSGFAGYLVNWIAKALFPFFTAYFLWIKKYSFAVLATTVQIALYLAFGNKAFLLAIGLVLILVLAGRVLAPYQIVSGVLVAGLVLGAAISSITQSVNQVSNTVGLRLLTVPAQIQYQYYDYFLHNDKLYFAETALGRLAGVAPPYSEGISFYITNVYAPPEARSNSNTGIFSDAFANAGPWAILLVGLFLGFYLILVDSATRNLPTVAAVGSFSYLVFNLNDVPFGTAMITGGGVLALLLSFALSRTSAGPRAPTGTWGRSRSVPYSSVKDVSVRSPSPS